MSISCALRIMSVYKEEIWSFETTEIVHVFITTIQERIVS